MNIYFKKFCDYLKKSKMFTEVITEKISIAAKAGGKNIKQYLYDDANVSNVALVVYDLLPFPVKLSMRYDNFHGLFLKNFSTIRGLILSKPDTLEEPKILPAAKKPKKVTQKNKVTVRKPVAKKVITKTALSKKVLPKKV